MLGQTQQDNGYVAETNVQTAYPLPQQLYVQYERSVSIQLITSKPHQPGPVRLIQQILSTRWMAVRKIDLHV